MMTTASTTLSLPSIGTKCTTATTPPRSFSVQDTRRISSSSSRTTNIIITGRNPSSYYCCKKDAPMSPVWDDDACLNKNTGESLAFTTVSSKETCSLVDAKTSNGEQNSTLKSRSPSQSRLRRRISSDLDLAYHYSSRHHADKKKLPTTTATTLSPRKDISMSLQKMLAHRRMENGHHSWCTKHSPQQMSDCDRVWGLKALVVEAERFQEERNLHYLKSAIVLTAAQSLGLTSPKAFYQKTKASQIIFADMNTLLSMPPAKQPSCGAISFAQREIQSFPLWRRMNFTQQRE